MTGVPAPMVTLREPHEADAARGMANRIRVPLDEPKRSITDRLAYAADAGPQDPTRE